MSFMVRCHFTHCVQRNIKHGVSTNKNGNSLVRKITQNSMKFVQPTCGLGYLFMSSPRTKYVIDLYG
jgi:hypothetical protein